MAALGNNPSLDRGSAVKLATGVAGANTIDFTICGEQAVNAIFQAIGTLTSLASALQFNSVGDNTLANFTDFIPAASFLAATKPIVGVSLAQNTPLVPGRYRINITAATGPVDIWVTISKG